MADFVTRRRHGVTRRMRLRGHDYRAPGYYFLTVTVEDGRCLFGRIRDAVFEPLQAGDVVAREWIRLQDRFPTLEWDEYCVMPNHFHALIGVQMVCPQEDVGPSVSSVMQAFKSITTVRYGEGVRSSGWPGYRGRLWHTGFHDHVIRSERELDRIRDYIVGNPAKWNEDRFYMP